MLSEWENGLQQIEIIDFKTASGTACSFRSRSMPRRPARTREFDTAVLRYNYQSLVSPPSVFDYDMNTRQATLVKQTEVPGGFDTDELHVGARVRHRGRRHQDSDLARLSQAGHDATARRRCCFTATARTAFSVAPTFSSSRLPLLDRGVVYAIAHIRGGGELGEPWRDAGRMMNKMNTFTDFIASAEHLIAQKYTSRIGW